MNRVWSKEEKARVIELRDGGMTFRAIGFLFRATENQVACIYRRARRPHTNGSSAKKDPATAMIMRAVGLSADRPDVPDEVWEDRDRRANAERTINMVLFGDPVVPRWSSNASS